MFRACSFVLVGEKNDNNNNNINNKREFRFCRRKTGLLAIPTFDFSFLFSVLGFFTTEGFAATASSSLRFTVPLLVAEHFRLLAPRCGTACHRRLRRQRLWQPSALDSRRFCSLSHILTFDSSDIFVTVYSGPSSVLNTQATLKNHDWLINWARKRSARRCVAGHKQRRWLSACVKRWISKCGWFACLPFSATKPMILHYSARLCLQRVIQNIVSSHIARFFSA